MSLLFNSENEEVKLGVVNVNEILLNKLKNEDIKIINYDNLKNPTEVVVEDELDAVLQFEEGKYIITIKNSDPSSAKGLVMKLKQILTTFSIPSTQELNLENIIVKTNYVYGSSETVFFDVLSPILIGFFVFFFVFLISGIGFLKERTSGTLEKLMSTPIKRGEIVAAYLTGFGLFAVFQTIIVVVFSIYVLEIVLVGSIWNVILINLVLALVALSLGTLLSAFAATEFQMVQFIPITIIPQFFFSGIIPIEGMANWLQILAKFMPIYYAADALKGVMYKGHDLINIVHDLLALGIFAVTFILLNILALKRYRRI